MNVTKWEITFPMVRVLVLIAKSKVAKHVEIWQHAANAMKQETTFPMVKVLAHTAKLKAVKFVEI